MGARRARPSPPAAVGPEGLPARLRGVHLPGRKGAFDVALADGRIAAIQPAARSSGRLALPAFAEPHVHADRAYSAHAPAPSLAEAVARMRALRARASEADIRARATHLLDRALAHGTLRLRTHTDVDPVLGLRAVTAVRGAAAGLAGRLEVAIVAFAHAGLDPATAAGRALLADALDAGAACLGGAPAFHPDPPASLRALTELAAARAVPLDLHLDEHLDQGALLTPLALELAEGAGMARHLTLSHACALALLPGRARRRLADRLARAGVTVVALPALNLFLQDRGQGRRRGLAPLRDLLAAGVAVRFGSDNVQDPFYPYGDADPLESAFLAALAAQIDDPAALLAGIAEGRSGLAAGDPADLVLLPATGLADALARRPAGRLVLRAGRVVAGGPPGKPAGHHSFSS